MNCIFDYEGPATLYPATSSAAAAVSFYCRWCCYCYSAEAKLAEK